MEAKLSEISVLARAALSLLEEEASPKTAEAATLLRRVAAAGSSFYCKWPFTACFHGAGLP